MLDQHLRHLTVAELSGDDQRRLSPLLLLWLWLKKCSFCYSYLETLLITATYIVHRVDLRLVLNQKLGHLHVVAHHAKVQCYPKLIDRRD